MYYADCISAIQEPNHSLLSRCSTRINVGHRKSDTRRVEHHLAFGDDAGDDRVAAACVMNQAVFL
jgi:hypothetical protein